MAIYWGAEAAYEMSVLTYGLVLAGAISLMAALEWGWAWLYSPLNEDGSPKSGGSCPAQN